MRHGKSDAGETIAEIRNVFRQHGFDGASLSILSEATGLKRASLYHRFPAGKEGMAIAAIDSAAEFLKDEVFSVLTLDEPWQKRLDAMCDKLVVYYDGGQSQCLLAAFSFGSIPKSVSEKVRLALGRWQDQLAFLAIDAGHSENSANDVGERILVEIQGGLILAALKNDVAPFRRALERLPTIVGEV